MKSLHACAREPVLSGGTGGGHGRASLCHVALEQYAPSQASTTDAPSPSAFEAVIVTSYIPHYRPVLESDISADE